MNAPVAFDANPGFLKLELSARGMRLDSSARARSGFDRVPAGARSVVRGIELVLPHDVWVSVPLEDDDAGASPFLLAGAGEQFTLRHAGPDVEVRVVAPPRFYERTTKPGRPMWQVGAVYGNFIAVHPAASCSYSLRGVPCRFCRSGGVAPGEAAPSVEEVVEVVRAAFEEGVAEFVYFNPPYAGSDDAGLDALQPYVTAVKRHFDTLVAVQMHPPRGTQWIDRTYAMGVDAVSYSVEMHDPDTLARRCAGRARYIGRERYYDALGYAATIFPRGTVWSDLVLGAEPIESTQAGIDALVGLGVLPVVCVVRPPRGAPPLGDVPLSPEVVTPVFAHLYRAVRQAKISMGWVRDLCTGITPLEARFFAGDAARLAVAMQHFYRSRLGGLATRNLGRLRRRLRVRRVSDSFDASHL